MTFNLHQLDNLDYDDAEPLLNDYIDEALNAFAKSAAGQKHIKSHPEGGTWVGTFIEMAYLYGGYTLPKMTKGNAQEVMEYILPRKLTLLEPSEAEDAIDELVAFWTFLDEVYRLRSARAIAKYLRSIEDKFPQWMFDPARGGFAKAFLMQGIEAGYDMSSQAGVEAFQAEYNRNLQAQGPMLPEFPIPSSTAEVKMTPPPADMKAAFDQLGLTLPKPGQAVDLMDLMEQFLGAVEKLNPEEAEQLLEVLEAVDEDEPSPPPPDTFLKDMRLDLLRQNLQSESSLTEAEQTLLETQTISETEPGTILRDFQTVLDLIDAGGLPVSGKLQHLSGKVLGELNEHLSHPIELDLKRPVQKSYPNLHGLYLLLRATGLTQVVAKGKQLRLVLNPEVYESWQQLNPTEQYFALIEAWLIRSHPEMLGGERSGPFTAGDRCLKTWAGLTEQSGKPFRDYNHQEQFAYWPGLYNLALMDLFGLIHLTSGKPEKGKGWRITKLQTLPWGNALMKLLSHAYLAAELHWPASVDPTLPFSDLQPTLQPYFPSWQNTLKPISYPFRAGRHIFKVSLGKIWRRIAISGEATLAHLSEIILDSVEFDHDHLDEFIYKSPLGRTIEVFHPNTFGSGDLFTHEVKIGSLPLVEGGVMEYVFDFGDNWEFQVQLEKVEPEAEPAPPKGFQKVKQTKRRKPSKKQIRGEILEVHGEAPDQYPSYEEDW